MWVGERKLGAVGVRIVHGVSSHGLALNVAPELAWFDAIVPCGQHGRRVTSLAAELGRAAVAAPQAQRGGAGSAGGAATVAAAGAAAHGGDVHAAAAVAAAAVPGIRVVAAQLQAALAALLGVRRLEWVPPEAVLPEH